MMNAAFIDSPRTPSTTPRASPVPSRETSASTSCNGPAVTSKDFSTTSRSFSMTPQESSTMSRGSFKTSRGSLTAPQDPSMTPRSYSMTSRSYSVTPQDPSTSLRNSSMASKALSTASKDSCTTPGSSPMTLRASFKNNGRWTSMDSRKTVNSRTPLLSDQRFRRMSTTEAKRRASMGGNMIQFPHPTIPNPPEESSKTRLQNRRESTYWTSFEKYVPFLAPGNSLNDCQWRKKITDQFVAIKEEKCNGDVRFDVTDLETGASTVPKRSSSTVKVIRRRQSGYGIAITSDSTAKMRCRQRKVLFQKRNRVCDLSLLLAIVGLILIVIDAELTALGLIDKESFMSVFLRSLCVASTVVLIFSLINYHRVEVKIALIDSGADDWRVAVTTERMIKLGIEIAVCSICPFPGSGTMSWPYISPEERRITMVSVPVDVILSVPMFLRAYLLCRFMVLHSKQFQDAATRSIAALNRISMDFRFVIKTMMADHPLTVLVIFTVSFWICMSWMFTQCERYNGRFTADHYYLNSLWFVTVSFLSVGYGDIVPSTYCGRMLAITTGIVGAGVSSALIAVISRKLELSRAEKHVNNFMADSKLTNQRKNAAASVLQQTWFIHKYQNTSNKGDDLRLRHHQRKFLNAINEFRRIKWDQRKLQERGNSLLDVGKLHNEMHETLWEMHRTQDQFIAQIDMLTQRIIELQNVVLNPSGPPQYTRQFNGGLTLQVPGVPQGVSNPENSFMDSSETVAIRIANPPIQRQSTIPQNQTRSNEPDNYSDYYSIRTAPLESDSKSSPSLISQSNANEEYSPLIENEIH